VWGADRGRSWRGEKGTDEAYTAVSTLISHENEQWVKYVSPAYLMVPEILGALDILPDPETASFTFAAPDGAEFEMTIAPTIVLAYGH